jgi:molybdopterin synthase sulfur carrier subunit
MPPAGSKKMTVKFFAYLREYTNCKIVDFPYQEDVRKLTQALSETYGNRLREKLLTPDGTDLGEEIIILVNGRHVEHLGGIDTKLLPTDTVSIFPVVAGG